MHSVFLAQSEVIEFRPADGEPHSLLSLKLNRKSVPPYVDDVDVVGVLRLRASSRATKDGRRVVEASGVRELVVGATGWAVSKNRFGVVDPVEVRPGDASALLGLVSGGDVASAAADSGSSKEGEDVPW